MGVVSGSSFLKSMFGFLITDPVLPILGVIVTGKLGGNAEDLGKRVSVNFAKTLAAVAMLAIGPFFSVPRTAATTHEIAVSQIFPNVPLWVSSIVFFIITIALVLNKSRTIDYVGKFLTPALLIVLTVIIFKCIINPIGNYRIEESSGFFLKGFKDGYQTMDALGASLVAGIVMTDVIRRGYTDKKSQVEVLTGAGIVAFVLLTFIYGGLTYIGARASSLLTPDMDRVDILLQSVDYLFGNVGKVIIGIGVSLACLTTSVGLTGACGDYFEHISNGKLKYKTIVLASSLFSMTLALFGVEGLISIAAPVLSAIYPVVIVLIVLSLFDSYIKYDLVYIGTVAISFILSLIETFNQVFNILEPQAEFIRRFPFKNIGMEWLLPTIAAGIISYSLAKIFNIGKSVK